MMEEAKDTLKNATRRMKKHANLKKRVLEFDLEDQVFLILTP